VRDDSDRGFVCDWLGGGDVLVYEPASEHVPDPASETTGRLHAERGRDDRSTGGVHAVRCEGAGHSGGRYGRRLAVVLVASVDPDGRRRQVPLTAFSRPANWAIICSQCWRIW
jgi:hypothetical protein